MSEFYIDLSRTRSAADDMREMARLFGQYERSLNECASRIRIRVGYSGLNEALRTVTDDIIVEKSQLAALSTALEKVARLYEESENKILGQSEKNVKTKPGTEADDEKKGAVEKTLELLEEIIGHDAMSFITCFVEALASVDGLGTGVDITAGILTTLNYLLDDLQDGATYNSLIANVIVSSIATVATMGTGIVTEYAITSAITSACAGATGGIGAAIAPFAAVIGKVAGTGVSILTGHLVDGFNEADWDRDGESNREEVKDALEMILNWVNPQGDDKTYYLPEGI